MNMLKTSVDQVVASSQAFLARLDVDAKLALAGSGEVLANAAPVPFDTEFLMGIIAHGISELDSPLSD
jgi:hypothetical protein